MAAMTSSDTFVQFWHIYTYIYLDPYRERASVKKEQKHFIKKKEELTETVIIITIIISK